MLSLILEAKRNGAEKIVIPPYERILFARYAGASNPFPKIPEMEERYGKPSNQVTKPSISIQKIWFGITKALRVVCSKLSQTLISLNGGKSLWLY
jgi:hypothetical protein